jgi:LysM repeat protein/N-acetylmuramoyl-L-alanine amidase
MRRRSRRRFAHPALFLLVWIALAAPSAVEATRGDATTVHTVRAGDTLYSIARQHRTDVGTLRSLNGLDGNRILVGQKLRVREALSAVPARSAPITTATIAVHVVERGETLTSISRHTGVKVSDLRDLNGLENDRIYVGQVLKLRQASRQTHIVERGDALWEIARAYGVTVEQLRTWNGLRNDRIHPGQELRVHVDREPPTAIHVVRRGDSLGEIARLHQMSLSELRKLNDLKGSVIHPGQRLVVRPLLGDDDDGLGLLAPHDIDWAALVPESSRIRRFEAANGPYFHQQPRASAQRSQTHIEEPRVGPWATYQQARALWTEFERRVRATGRLSRSLEGWTIVLDPGHGGVDPGTIVRSETGNGESVYVVEDEYVYDVALRMYVLLSLHGAKVDLTLLAPNHLLRGNDPPIATFVHERNEVFNSAKINRANAASSWPSGNRVSLARRKEVARDHLAGAKTGRRMFVSLHADNSPRSKDAMTVFYSSTARGVDHASRRFAEALLPALGADATTRGRGLAVLNGNPADIAVLIEVRNLAYANQAWMLRHDKQRQRDAEKIVKGILDWTEGQDRPGPIATR